MLVQGTAHVDDADLDANAARYRARALEKLPGAAKQMPPQFFDRSPSWYFKRIYLNVRPERVYVWPGGDVGSEPQLFDSHLEEVRSGHVEEPRGCRPPKAAALAWDERMNELGARYPHAVVSLVAPDGFPFSRGCRSTVDPEARRGAHRRRAHGRALVPGSVCVTAHDHAAGLHVAGNFQVRGDLVQERRPGR